MTIGDKLLTKGLLQTIPTLPKNQYCGTKIAGRGMAFVLICGAIKLLINPTLRIIFTILLLLKLVCTDNYILIGLLLFNLSLNQYGTPIRINKQLFIKIISHFDEIDDFE